MRLQPTRNKRTEASVAIFNDSPAIFKDVFIGPYLESIPDMQNLADIPADNRGSTRIGIDVDPHYGLTGSSFCTHGEWESLHRSTRYRRVNEGRFWQEHVEPRTLVLMKGKLGGEIGSGLSANCLGQEDESVRE